MNTQESPRTDTDSIRMPHLMFIRYWIKLCHEMGLDYTVICNE